MRAVFISKHGEPSGIGVSDVATPAAPTGDRIRVRVRAAGLNRADLLQRRGRYPAPPGYPENIPGLEFAGEVETLGDAADIWKVGDRVFGITAGGAQAEYVVVPQTTVARIPENLNWAEAGAVPEVFITAHDALFTRARLQRGERVLVHAAGSGVGTAAVQLAHAAGATVFGTSRTPDKLERVRDFGLNEAIVIHREPAELRDAVQRLTDGAGVNVVLDLVGGAYLPVSIETLAIGGRVVCVGTTAGVLCELNIGAVMRKRATIIGTVLRSRSVEEKADAVRRFAEDVVPLLESGRVRPVVEAVYAPEEIRSAHEHMESNRTVGKLVLSFA